MLVAEKEKYKLSPDNKYQVNCLKINTQIDLDFSNILIGII